MTNDASSGRRNRLIILLGALSLCIIVASLGAHYMDRDANRAVKEKLLLIDRTVLAIDVKMTTTQVFDVLRSHGINARQVVGSGNRFAFSLPVERALARRCITALVDRGVVTTKVLDRPCNPSDPQDR